MMVTIDGSRDFLDFIESLSFIKVTMEFEYLLTNLVQRSWIPSCDMDAIV